MINKLIVAAYYTHKECSIKTTQATPIAGYSTEVPKKYLDANRV